MQKKIFIFDDDQDILNICSIILKTKGYEVRTHSNCNDLMELILAFGPDVVVMDNKIPEIGGVEATRLIKKDARTAATPVILFSANTHVAELTKEAGADRYIQKPFDITAFEEILENTIRQQQLSKDQAV
jgi:DNA-binding response OmpR family regulator